MARRKRDEGPAPADFYIGFNGAVPINNVDEPKLGDIVEWTVRGMVRFAGDKLNKDGETRAIVTVSVEDAWPADGQRPDSANQALMFTAGGEPTPEATDGEPAA